MLFRISLLAVALFITGCSRQRTSVAVDAALLTQVPGDTVALGAMRVKALRGTAAWKKLLEQKSVNERLDKLAEKEPPMSVTVEGDKVTVVKGQDQIQTSKGAT